MKIFLTGVKRQHGIGKDSKQPYDMFVALQLVPIDVGQFGGMTVVGAGYEGAEMQISPQGFAAVNALKFPGMFDLECEQRMNRGKAETMITGVVGLIQAKAA